MLIQFGWQALILVILFYLIQAQNERPVDSFYAAMPFKMGISRYSQFFIRVSLKWTDPSKRLDRACWGKVYFSANKDTQELTYFDISFKGGTADKTIVTLENPIIDKEKFAAAAGSLDVFQLHFNTFNTYGSDKDEGYVYYSLNGKRLAKAPAPQNLFDSINTDNKYNLKPEWRNDVRPLTTIPANCAKISVVTFSSTREEIQPGSPLSLGISNFLPLGNSFKISDRIFARIYRQLPVHPKKQTFGLAIGIHQKRKATRELEPLSANDPAMGALPKKWTYGFNNDLVQNQILVVSLVVETFEGPKALANSISVGQGRPQVVCTYNDAREPAFSVGIQAGANKDVFLEHQWPLDKSISTQITWDLRGINPVSPDASQGADCRKLRHGMDCVRQTCLIDINGSASKLHRVLFVGSTLSHDDEPSKASPFTVRYRIEREGKQLFDSPLEKFPLTWTPKEVADYMR